MDGWMEYSDVHRVYKMICTQLRNREDKRDNSYNFYKLFNKLLHIYDTGPHKQIQSEKIKGSGKCGKTVFTCADILNNLKEETVDVEMNMVDVILCFS